MYKEPSRTIDINLTDLLPSELQGLIQIEPCPISIEEKEFATYRLEHLSPLEKIQFQAIAEIFPTVDTAQCTQLLEHLYNIQVVEGLETDDKFAEYILDNLYDVETLSDFHESYNTGQIGNYFYLTIVLAHNMV